MTSDPAGRKLSKTSRRSRPGLEPHSRRMRGASSMALEQPELRPRELATRFTDTKLLRLGILVYRLLKATT